MENIFKNFPMYPFFSGGTHFRLFRATGSLLINGLTSLREVSPIAAMLVLIPQLNAASVDDLTYSVENGKVTITNCDNLATGTLQVPNLIEGLPVTAIGDNSFVDCAGITSVTLPDSVTSIGNNAFSGSALATFEFPALLVSIGGSAFSKTHLSKIIIPPSVTHIGGSAFQGCHELISAKFLAESPLIGPSAFSDCTSLSEVGLPSRLALVAYGTFAGCRALNEIIVPGSVLDIGGSAFQNCGLRKARILGTYNIGLCAFADNPELSEVELSPNLSWVFDYAFDGCSLTRIEFPAKLSSIGTHAFNTYSGIDPSLNPLKFIRFDGRAPELGANPFGLKINPNCTVFVGYQASGFTFPEWAGMPCKHLKPGVRVETNGGKVVKPGVAVKSFGMVKIGSSGSDVSFRITNTGNYRVDFLSTRTEGRYRKDFLVKTPPATTLEPGQSVVVKVRFRPKGVGIRDCDLYFFVGNSGVGVNAWLWGTGKK